MTEIVTASQYRALRIKAEKKPVKRKKNTEYDIQCAFMREMSAKYPGVLVFSDTAAHIGKTLFQQIRANKLSSQGEKWPDVFIAQPSGEYAGMYIEFKAETPYKKDGVTLLKNDHIETQAKTMQKLRERGYFVPDFIWSVEMAVAQVDWYLGL
jgi:hypothetical protein